MLASRMEIFVGFLSLSDVILPTSDKIGTKVRQTFPFVIQSISSTNVQRKLSFGALLRILKTISTKHCILGAIPPGWGIPPGDDGVQFLRCGDRDGEMR